MAGRLENRPLSAGRDPETGQRNGETGARCARARSVRAARARACAMFASTRVRARYRCARVVQARAAAAVRACSVRVSTKAQMLQKAQGKARVAARAPCVYFRHAAKQQRTFPKNVCLTVVTPLSPYSSTENSPHHMFFFRTPVYSTRLPAGTE